MVVSINWGPLCGCPLRTKPTIWALYFGPGFLETLICNSDGIKP